jgi:hypothetical protein
MDTTILKRMHDTLHKLGKVIRTGPRADKHYIVEDWETRITIIDRTERGEVPATNTYVIRHHHPVPKKLLYHFEEMVLKNDEMVESKVADPTAIRLKLLKLKNKNGKTVDKIKKQCYNSSKGGVGSGKKQRV